MKTKNKIRPSLISLAVLGNVPTRLELESRKMLIALPPHIKKKRAPKKKEARKLKELVKFALPPAGFLYLYGKDGTVLAKSNQISIETLQPRAFYADGGMCMPQRGHHRTGDGWPIYTIPPERIVHINNTKLLADPHLFFTGGVTKTCIITQDGKTKIEAHICITEMDLPASSKELHMQGILVGAANIGEI